MNQILPKPKFFAINILETSHKSPNSNDIILKKVKIILLPNKITPSVKTETTRIDYYYIGKNLISKSINDNLRHKNCPDAPQLVIFKTSKIKNVSRDY